MQFLLMKFLLRHFLKLLVLDLSLDVALVLVSTLGLEFVDFQIYGIIFDFKSSAVRKTEEM